MKKVEVEKYLKENGVEKFIENIEYFNLPFVLHMRLLNTRKTDSVPDASTVLGLWSQCDFFDKK